MTDVAQCLNDLPSDDNMHIVNSKMIQVLP